MIKPNQFYIIKKSSYKISLYKTFHKDWGGRTEVVDRNNHPMFIGINEMFYVLNVYPVTELANRYYNIIYTCRILNEHCISFIDIRADSLIDECH